MLRTPLVAFTLAAGLVLTSPASAQGKRSAKPAEAPDTIELATLGMTTTAPTRQEAKARGLKIEVRIRGQLVTAVEPRGPAAKAGIRKGDVLVQIDNNEIYSQDDIADFLVVSKPEQKVDLLVVRAKGNKAKTLRAVLGGKRVKAPKEPRLEWQFASLGQLDAAIAKAKKEQRLILIGLSGAET